MLKKSNTNAIIHLPIIITTLLPEGYEILPNTSELFELAFAFYEYQLLSKDQIIKRGSFFKSIDGKPTNHYIICSASSSLVWEGRSEITKSCFKEGSEETKEWSDEKIQRLINTNEYFRKGIVNIFFEGATIPFLTNVIPLFELKNSA